jgi:glucan phosphoethanolaminetransferase (alkaline phosphatase superfamily)
MFFVSSVAGPFLVLAGLAGMFGFGIPGPYWLAAVLFGASMILVGQRGLKYTRPVKATDTPEMQAYAQKRHRFWIFVAIASSLYALGAYWLPVTTPEMRQHLVVAIMSITFILCIGIFIYAMFPKQKS